MLAQKFEIQAASATQETASMHSGEGTHLFTSASEPFGPMQAYLGEGVEMFTSASSPEHASDAIQGDNVHLFTSAS
ncbi:MAG: hypothetical protein HN543_06085, partial [Rhodobacteraceae bacterium]|nr:hypothetical protein [Paracoccaceae bacterium]